MLVLSRKKDETIRIGDHIVIRICQLKGNSVRIGIEAPESVSIKRGELPNWIGELDIHAQPAIANV